MSVHALDHTDYGTADVAGWDTGAAVGTDTTHVALRKAQQLCAFRLKVGLFCRSMGLATYWRDEVMDWRQAVPVHTGRFSDYALRLGTHDPDRLLRAVHRLPEHRKLDAIVVHEAPDFTDLEWRILRASLRTPVCPENHVAGRVFAYSDVAQADAVAAPSVPASFQPCFTDDAEDLAMDCVVALRREGWRKSEIAVLTTGRRHPYHEANLLDAASPTAYWASCHAGDEEFYGQVREFRGLERPAVVLCVNGFDDSATAAEQMRVGLSRARNRLVVVGNPAVIDAAAGRGTTSVLARALPTRAALARRLPPTTATARS
ncbi:hypothetical protein [Arthrobacter sp. KK5.5]|uniref:hypothetical protein n=1 Tax=Arthrobacter sp. KK5.5 TaxID=3373084 RepID=UPI003EE6D46A